MDITVKNAYNRICAACESIESVYCSSSKRMPLTNLLAEGVFVFIHYISKANANERYAYFNEIYQQGKYPSTNMNCHVEDGKPEIMLILMEYSNRLGGKLTIRPDELLVAFLGELGKHYLISRYDKSEIDAEKYVEYIHTLQDCIRMTKENKDLHNKLSEGKGVVSKTKKTKKTEGEETADKSDAVEDAPSETEPEESLEELLEKLNTLIGLAGVKREVTSLINLLKIKRIRDSRGMGTANISKHLVFLGNPGTGKTTVARLISKIYKQLGVLEKGQLVEVDRAGLVAGYVGQTALKTKEKIDEAMGGILFVDEAYTLAKGSSDFGQEAIDTILKAMEDNRENFVVIVAGYPDPMKLFLESNPGLKSRFNKEILFEDYSEYELLSIFEAFCKPYGMQLHPEAEQYVSAYLSWLVTHKDENFANGREMRNLFELALTNQANRLANQVDITDDELNELTVEDLPQWVICPGNH